MDTRVRPAYDDLPVNTSLILFAEMAVFAGAVSRGLAVGVVISAGFSEHDPEKWIPVFRKIMLKQ